MRSIFVSLALLLAGSALASEQPPTLAIGSAMPAFSLPGIDGKTYTDQCFKDANILVMVFTCAHCPTAQAYQERIKKLVTDYKLEGRDAGRDQSEPRRCGAPRRAGVLGSLGFLRGNEGARQAREIQLRLARRRPEAGDVAQVRPGRDAACVHLRQGAQASLRRPHRRFRARIHRHQARHARRARRAAGRQGAAGHHHARCSAAR